MEIKGKKILIVTPFFYPAWHYGGPPRVIFDLCKTFSTDGFDVTCVATDVLDKKRHNKTQDNIEGIKILYFKNFSNKLAYYFKVFTPLGLKKYLNENVTNFDIVHIVDYRNSCTNLAYRACEKHHISYVISPYGSMPYKRDLRGLVKGIIDKKWGITCLRNAKSVIVQTENEKNEALKLGVVEDKIQVIPLMIDAKKFNIKPDLKNSIKEKYNIPQNTKIILFVGRLNKHKATNNMLLAFEKLLKNNPQQDFRFFIIGRDDGYENELKQMAKKLNLQSKIIFTGPIFYPDTVEFYKASNVFFMAPSHFEETSTASLEALACGTPVVVTVQADIPYFSEYKAGVIVKNELTFLVEALEKILIKNEFSEDDCVNIITDHFDINTITQNYLKVYFS